MSHWLSPAALNQPLRRQGGAQVDQNPQIIYQVKQPLFNEQQSTLAQRKRAGLITRRTTDRNGEVLAFCDRFRFLGNFSFSPVPSRIFGFAMSALGVLCLVIPLLSKNSGWGHPFLGSAQRLSTWQAGSTFPHYFPPPAEYMVSPIRDPKFPSQQSKESM